MQCLDTFLSLVIDWLWNGSHYVQVSTGEWKLVSTRTLLTNPLSLHFMFFYYMITVVYLLICQLRTKQSFSLTKVFLHFFYF